MKKTDPKEYIGKTYLSKEGSRMTVIDLKSFKEVIVEFDKGHRLTVQLGNLRRGTITDPYYPSVCGVGFKGIGRHLSSIRKVTTKVYQKWHGMFIRGYYTEDIRNRTYIASSIASDWHCFQNFGDWFDEHYNPEIMQDWHLDKDILVKGNKIYSAQTCELVPPEINALFLRRESKRGKYPIGVHKSGKRFVAQMRINGEPIDLGTYDRPEEAFCAYKTAKEYRIKEIANKWRGKITERCYFAMVNYQVEITD